MPSASRRASKRARAQAASATGTARGTMQGSWRPRTTRSAFSIRSRSTLGWCRPMDGVGLRAMRHTTGRPVVMPPRMPPALLDCGQTRPSSTRYASLFSLPRSSAAPKPTPNSTPLTAGMPNTIRAMRFSMPSNMGSPSPAGTPYATHSITPPTLSRSFFASMMQARMFVAAAALTQGRGLARMAASCTSLGFIGSSGVSSIREGPRLAMCAAMRTPRASSACSAIPPAMHKGAVRRPEKWPPPATSWNPPYLTWAGQSAWPGRGLRRSSS